MQFSFATVSLTLLALSVASPVPKTSEKKAKASASTSAIAAAATGASTATAATGGSTLSATDYNTIQISDGTAGDAETKANAIFASIDMSNLAAVSADDLNIIKGVHDAAEDAEVQAFNPAIEAATGDAATALQNGKIQNKVLKLTAEVLGIQVEAAQGGDGSDLAAEQTKLAKNIATDKAAAGGASQSAPFTASIPA